MVAVGTVHQAALLRILLRGASLVRWRPWCLRSLRPPPATCPLWASEAPRSDRAPMRNAPSSCSLSAASPMRKGGSCSAWATSGAGECSARKRRQHAKLVRHSRHHELCLSPARTLPPRKSSCSNFCVRLVEQSSQPATRDHATLIGRARGRGHDHPSPIAIASALALCLVQLMIRSCC